MLNAAAPDGGFRTQRVVGRIGGGIFDTSWATIEVDPITGKEINRLFFAPVETVTGHGLELSPFEYAEIPSGMNMPLTQDCLTCHTDTSLAGLPGVSSDGKRISPSNALGADVFSHLQPLDCEACHGASRRHVEIMSGLGEAAPSDKGALGLEILAAADPARQRDVCARCHLQGDVRFQMVDGRPDTDRPLAAQFPTLVTTDPGDDFRFVGQLERLSLSECFLGSAAMTCSTCHDPHVSFKEQGITHFEKTCIQCHGGTEAKAQQSTCNRPDSLTVASVTGSAARGEAGCVDCHVRQSPPFDLPGIATTDHWVRRNIPKPKDVPFRSLTEPDKGLKLWPDKRLEPAFKTAAGRLWKDGVLAMGLVQTGRFQEAMTYFDRFPKAGDPKATRATAPAPLESLETWPTFHQLRGMSLLAARRPQEAVAAFSDALRLDPKHPGALMDRARAGLIVGNQVQSMTDTQTLIETYPEAEGPWRLRATMAQRLGRPDFQIKGLEEVVARWPSDAGAWMQLAQLYRATGQEIKASDALERVRLMQPSLLKPGQPANR